MQIQTTLPNPALARTEAYRKIRRQTELLCTHLHPEDYVLQPIYDVSPARWHLAHTSWYFEQFLLKQFLPDYKEFHPQYNFFFNSYYDSVGQRWQRTERGQLSRPTVAEVMLYRGYVDAVMEQLLEQSEEKGNAFKTFFQVGLNHEQQHQELLVTDVKYSLGLNPLFPAFLGEEVAPPYTDEPASLRFVEVHEGVYTIGAKEDDCFAWDNEYPAHRVFLEPFALSNRLVTNEEYMEFMQEGGYTDYRHWLMEGWELANAQKWQAPLHWHQVEGQWMEYTTSGLKAPNPQAPVTHVSFYEADAYAEWKGCRLPTEQEWEAAAQGLETSFYEGNFADNGLFHPLPAKGTDGLLQMGGDCWEWTYSSYHPYPGYRKAEGALGEYNGKFTINQMVLRGGSCATPKHHMRHTYRNFFHPDKRWQFSGIRLAKTL